MKYISPESVRNIIKLADKAFPETIEPSIVDGADLSLQDIEIDPDNLKSLAQTIEDLDVNEIDELCALIYLGSNERTADLTAEKIADLSPLAEYLKKGLLKMEANG